MKGKKLLALALCLAMLLSLTPGAFAAGGGGGSAAPRGEGELIVVNVPYDTFYHDIIGIANGNSVDAVTSATTKVDESKGKVANFWSNPYAKTKTDKETGQETTKYYAPMAYGDYETGIQGVMLPVQVSQADFAKLNDGTYSSAKAYSWMDYEAWVDWANENAGDDVLRLPETPGMYAKAAVSSDRATCIIPSTRSGIWYQKLDTKGSGSPSASPKKLYF